MNKCSKYKIIESVGKPLLMIKNIFLRRDRSYYKVFKNWAEYQYINIIYLIVRRSVLG